MLIDNKICISPSQALLILIEHYQNDTQKKEQLEKLYLLGAKSSTDFLEINEHLMNPILNSYRVKFDMLVIQKDPTRRYFETLLAYNTFLNFLNQLSFPDLYSNYQGLLKKFPADVQISLENFFQGKINPAHHHLLVQYGSYLEHISKAKHFNAMNALDKIKWKLLIKSCFLSLWGLQHVKNIPLDIYHIDIYQDKNRGRILIEEQRSTRNQNYGLLKSYMPLAKDDFLLRNTIYPGLKPSDQSDFDETAVWVQDNFSYFMHPFSNAISGTILCQLRFLLMLKNENKGIFTNSIEQFSLYMKLMISVMLFYSGGHSLHEYCAPFQLPDVQNAFKDIIGFEKLSLETLFYVNNRAAFFSAIRQTITYNQMILKRQMLMMELNSKNKRSNLFFSREKVRETETYENCKLI